MVPGRRYDLRFLIRTLRRSWWMLVIPLGICGTIAFVLARALPDVYYAQGTVRIIPPRLAEHYVKGVVELSVPERVATARAQVVSQQQLQALISEFDIYPSMRGRVPSDALVSWLRSSIRVNLVQKDMFSVGYYGYSKQRVEKVTQRLTQLMVEETTKQREALSDNQGQFLETELEGARKRLEEQERKVSEYRRRYGGQLPTQVEANLGLLRGASADLQTAEEAQTKDRTRRDELARELETAAAAETVAAPPEAEIADPPAGNPTATLPAGPPAQQLKAARALRVRMLRRFTQSHPDVQQLDRYIAQLEIAVANAPTDPAAPATDPSRIGQLRVALRTLDAQIAGREVQLKRLRDTVGSYRGRVDAAPDREAEWLRLTRDLATLQGTYTTLLGKREESRIAASVDRQAVGEQIVVVDPPRRPEAPVSPNRKLVMLIGVGLGLGLGLALLVISELRDRTIRAEEEVLAALNLPVVGLVPRIITANDRRQLRRRRLLWSFAALAVCVGLAALRWR
jgi:polysaccharide chain length determinant protein (PEP-CTERM system associated)